jgi:protein gp37
MNKQGPNGIGWCTETWNPVRGLCPESCDFCYARRIYARFHYDPTIRLDEKELMAPYKLKKPARIFCGSTIDIFHQDIHGGWLRQIVTVIKDNPQHVFQFLYHFSPHRGVFPYNCWLGLTVTSYRDANKAVMFSNTYPDHIKFISFEPLLGDPEVPEEVFENIIVKLLNAADRHHLPVYMKDNIQQYWHHYLRKEFPKRK